MKPKKQTPKQDMEGTLSRYKVRTSSLQKDREVKALVLGLALAEYFTGNGISDTFQEFNKKHLSEEDANKLHKAKEEANESTREHICDLLDELGRTRQEALDFVLPARGALMALGAYNFCIKFYKDKFNNS